MSPTRAPPGARLGRDAPAYRPSPGSFSAALRDVEVRLPVRDAPNRRKAIRSP